MNNCKTKETILQQFLDNDLIDDKLNIIGNADVVFPYIHALNQYARTNFNIDGDIVTTNTIKNASGSFVKINIDDTFANHIDRLNRNQYKDSAGISEPLITTETDIAKEINISPTELYLQPNSSYFDFGDDYYEAGSKEVVGNQNGTTGDNNQVTDVLNDVLNNVVDDLAKQVNQIASPKKKPRPNWTRLDFFHSVIESQSMNGDYHL
jgi:hypothetical protein